MLRKHIHIDKTCMYAKDAMKCNQQGNVYKIKLSCHSRLLATQLQGSATKLREMAYNITRFLSNPHWNAHLGTVWEPHTKPNTDTIKEVLRRAAPIVINRYHCIYWTLSFFSHPFPATVEVWN